MADSIAVNPPSSLIAKVEKLLCAPAPFQSPYEIIIKLYSAMIDKTRLKKVRDCEHMTFFGISSKNFYAYF